MNNYYNDFEEKVELISFVNYSMILMNVLPLTQQSKKFFIESIYFEVEIVIPECGMSALVKCVNIGMNLKY